MKMIEIKCSEFQKEIIKMALLGTQVCIIDNDNCRSDNCYNCLEKNIKWTIRGNEDAE